MSATDATATTADPADAAVPMLRAWDESEPELDPAGPITFSRKTAVFRLMLFLGLSIAVLPLQAVLSLTGRRLSELLPRIYLRLLARVAGLRITLSGRRAKSSGTLYVANHVSYLDILVLGALLPASFVAKQEVSSWPGIGFAAGLGRTIFLDRRGVESKRASEGLRERLALGDRIIMFPEATSTDGSRVLPFRSSLFQAVMEVEGAVVQPVSIAYTRLNGVPLGRVLRPFVAWYGDMTLVPHVWDLLSLGRLDVTVIIHPPIAVADAIDRKSLAKACHDVVGDGVSVALAGRIGRDVKTGRGPRASRVLP